MAKQRAQLPPAPPVQPDGWSEGNYYRGGVVIATVREAASNDPRQPTFEWQAAGRVGRHVGTLESAQARALDQYARHA